MIAYLKLLHERHTEDLGAFLSIAGLTKIRPQYKLCAVFQIDRYPLCNFRRRPTPTPLLRRTGLVLEFYLQLTHGTASYLPFFSNTTD